MVAFSPDDRWLLTGTDTQFRIWAFDAVADSWKLSWQIRKDQFSEHVGSAAFTPDGKYLAVSLSPFVLGLIDCATGLAVARLHPPDADPVNWFEFSPDGGELIVVTHGAVIHVWDLNSIRSQLGTIGLDWEPQSDLSANERQSHELPEVIIDFGEWAPVFGSMAHTNRATQHVRAKKWQLAIAEYTDAVSLDPNNAAVLNEFAWLLATCPEGEFRNVASAMAYALKAVELQPNDAAIWNTVGVVRYRSGEWAGAIEALTRSEQLEPGKHFGFNAFFIAMAHWQLNTPAVKQTPITEDSVLHRDEAHRWYQQAVEWTEQNKPDDVELRRFQIEAMELLGIKDAAKS
jgi:hypothetical protein